jgi:hypothetical protein
MRWSWIGLLAITAAGCGGSAPQSSQAQPAPVQTSPAATPGQRAAALAPQQPEPAAAADQPTCQVTCSTDRPRSAVATVSWPMSQAPANPAALASAMNDQRLEVTTFKDGFSRGAFVQLAPQGGQAFAFGARGAPPSTLPGLTALSVAKVSTLQDRLATGPANPGAFAAPPPAADPSRVVVIEIEGLEAGLNYYWRRTPTGPIVRCQAPVCPADARGRQ